MERSGTAFIYEKKITNLLTKIRKERYTHGTNRRNSRAIKSRSVKSKELRRPNGQGWSYKKLIAKSIEQMLESEITEHLGYEKHSPEGRNSDNSRNGKTHKTLKNDNGEIEITVPRNRNGQFDPIILKKYERSIGPIEDKIISMYAKEMTVRDIQSHIHWILQA